LVRISEKILQKIGCTETIREYGIAKWRVYVVGIIRCGKIERRIAVECSRLSKEKEATITPLFDALYHVENKDDVQKMLDEWKKLNALELKEVTRSLKKAQSVIGEAKEMLERTWDKMSEQILTILDESNYSVFLMQKEAS